MAFTFAGFIDQVIAGNPIKVRSSDARTNQVVLIGGLSVPITENWYDLGAFHTAQTVLESQALRRGVQAGVIIAEAGTLPLNLQTGLTRLWDGTRQLVLEDNGGVPVNLQDQHTPTVDYMFHIHLGDATLAANVAIDTRTLTLVAGHGVVVGNLLTFRENGRYFECIATVVNVNTVTISGPFDYAFTTSALVARASTNLAVDGSSTPVIAHVEPPVGTTWDITRLLFYIQDNVDMDDSKFGGLTALANGCVFRIVNDVYHNLFNIKTNGAFALRGFEPQYVTKAAAGSYAIRGMRKFGGQNETGVVLRIVPPDELQIIIQDNLTGLDMFNVVCQGHVVTGM